MSTMKEQPGQESGFKECPSSSSTISNQMWVNLISGYGAGVICTCLCAPLDVVKIRLQVQGSLGISKYHGLMPTLRTIYQEEGIRGCYRGLSPALATVPLFWSLYWTVYGHTKDYMANNSDFKDVPLPAQHIVAAMSAGAVGDIITNPLWVVRTRIQTRVLHKSSTVSSAPGIMEMARYILRKEDFFSFYRGLGASFLGLSHVAVQFPVYEMLKAKAAARRANGEVHMVDVLVSSIVAKTIASFLTYPHEVIRARLQDLHGGDKGIIGIIRTTVKEEGFFSLWNGLKVNVCACHTSYNFHFCSV